VALLVVAALLATNAWAAAVLDRSLVNLSRCQARKHVYASCESDASSGSKKTRHENPNPNDILKLLRDTCINMPPPAMLAALVKQRSQSSCTTASKASVDGAAAAAIKERGNKLLQQNDLLAAYAQYSAGLACAGKIDAAKLLGNRSAAALKLGWSNAAIEDACAAVTADATYARGWFRLAAALVEAADPLATEACTHAADLAPQDPGPARLFERAKHEAVERYKPGKVTMVAVAVAPAPEETDAVDGDSDDSDGDDDSSERVVSLSLATRTQTSGGTVWDASVLLAAWLATDPTVVKGRNILELGAGCGAVGLACATLGARHVALTDFDVGVVKLLAENARSNYLRAGCDSYELDVAKMPEAPRAEFDLVVGSECVYYGACDAVPALVEASIGKSGGLCGVFCMADSRAGIDAFATAAEKRFRYERRPFPRQLRRRARRLNAELAAENTYSLHLLYRI